MINSDPELSEREDLRQRKQSGKAGVKPMRDEMVCRCEEVTKSEIEEAIRNGAASIDDVKKATHSAMGYCQGKTCRRLIAQLLAQYYKRPVSDFLPGSIRMPVGPVTIEELAKLTEDR